MKFCSTKCRSSAWQKKRREETKKLKRFKLPKPRLMSLEDTQNKGLKVFLSLEKHYLEGSEKDSELAERILKEFDRLLGVIAQKKKELS
jgi:hypothetical protein